MATTTVNIKVPDNPLTMLTSSSNDFSIIATAAIRPTVSSQTSGEPITWEFINDANHDHSFFRGLTLSGNTGVKVRYPSIKKVLALNATSDESFSNYGVHWGASVGLQEATIEPKQFVTYSGRWRGNGSGGFAARGFTSSDYTLSFNSSTGLISVSDSSNIKCLNSEAITITYTGLNNYRIRRDYTSIPLNGGVVAKFYLVDNSTNTVVTSNPTSDDSITLIGGSISYYVRTNIYSTFPISGNSFMFSGVFNAWVIGAFELWMKAAPISDTEIKVKWQEKSGVTEYRLNRATSFTIDANGDYVLTSPTQVYTGTDLSFIDTGLTSDTMYYYQLTDQTDTEITQFNTKTL